MPKRKSPHIKRESGDYAGFLRDIKLIGLGLASCSASLDRGPYFELSVKGQSTRSISADYKLVDIQKEFFDVVAKFTLSVQGKSETQKPLVVECAFAGHFHCTASELPREFAERFTQSELRLILWPYFRELVSDLTAKMAIPPISVPLSTEQ